METILGTTYALGLNLVLTGVYVFGAATLFLLVDDLLTNRQRLPRSSHSPPFLGKSKTIG